MVQSRFNIKVFAYFMMSMLLPVLLFFALLFYNEQVYDAQAQDAVNRSLLKSQTHLLDVWLLQKQSYLRWTSRFFQEESSSSTNDILRYIARGDTELDNVLYYDFETQKFSKLKPLVTREDYEATWAMGSALTQLTVSKPVVSLQTQERLIIFSIPVKDNHNQIRGILGFAYPISSLEERITGRNIHNASRYSMLYRGLPISDLSEDGVDARSGLENTADQANPPASENTDQLLNVTKGKRLYKSDLCIPDYALIYQVPYGGEIQKVFAVGSEGFVEFVGTALALLLLTYTLLWDSTSPMKKFRKRVTDLLDENISIPVEVEDPDVQQIYREFWKFNQHIKKHVTELEGLNRSLDNQRLVVEAANEEMQKSLNVLVTGNEKLLERRTFYQGIMDHLTNMIWSTDAYGCFSYVSGKLSAAVGCRSEALIGKPLGMIFDEGPSDGVSLLELFKRRDFYDIELQLWNIEHTQYLTVSTRTVRIFENGAFMGLQGISRDISDERRSHVDFFYKSHEIFVIHEINRMMTYATNDLNKILSAITQKMHTLLNVDHCNIRILKGDHLELMSLSGESKYLFDSVPVNAPYHIAYAFRNGETIILRSKADLLYDDPATGSVLDYTKNIVYVPLVNENKVFGILTIIALVDIEAEKLNILQYLAHSASVAIVKSMLYDQLRENYIKTIEALTNALDVKVSNTQGHTRRVSQYAKIIAKALFLKEQEIDDIQIAGLLHDVGKIGIHDRYLRVRDEEAEVPIDPDERERAVAEHPAIAERILRPIGFSQTVLDGIYFHHKRYDLTGYPEDPQISAQPLAAQIIQAANALDNKSKGLGTEKTSDLSEIIAYFRQESGTTFSPEISDVIIELIQREHQELRTILEM